MQINKYSFWHKYLQYCMVRTYRNQYVLCRDEEYYRVLQYYRT